MRVDYGFEGTAWQRQVFYTSLTEDGRRLLIRGAFLKLLGRAVNVQAAAIGPEWWSFFTRHNAVGLQGFTDYGLRLAMGTAKSYGWLRYEEGSALGLDCVPPRSRRKQPTARRPDPGRRVVVFLNAELDDTNMPSPEAEARRLHARVEGLRSRLAGDELEPALGTVVQEIAFARFSSADAALDRIEALLSEEEMAQTRRTRLVSLLEEAQGSDAVVWLEHTPGRWEALNASGHHLGVILNTPRNQYWAYRSGGDLDTEDERLDDFEGVAEAKRMIERLWAREIANTAKPMSEREIIGAYRRMLVARVKRERGHSGLAKALHALERGGWLAEACPEMTEEDCCYLGAAWRRRLRLLGKL